MICSKVKLDPRNNRLSTEMSEKNHIGSLFLLQKRTKSRICFLFTLLLLSLTFRVNTWAIFTSKIPSASAVVAYICVFLMWTVHCESRDSEGIKEERDSRHQTHSTWREENNELIVFEQESSLTNVTTWERKEETVWMFTRWMFRYCFWCLKRTQ